MNKDEDQIAALAQLHKSIEVIKWCIIAITTIMVLAIIVAIWTLNSVRNEVVRVQANVDEVRPKVAEVVEKTVEIVDGVKQLTDGLQVPMAAAKKLLRDELVAKLEELIHR